MAWYWCVVIAVVAIFTVVFSVRVTIRRLRGTKLGCKFNLHDDLIVKEFRYVNEVIYGLECTGCGRCRCSVLGRVPRSITQYTEATKLARPWLEGKLGRKIYGGVSDAF